MDVLRPDVPTILPAPMVLNDVGVPGQRRLNFFAATFSIEGNALITFDFDHYTYINASDSRGPIRRGFVRRWDLLGKEILPTTLCELDGIEPMAAFSPDARFLASATNERGQSAYTSVRVWRLDSSGKNPVTLGETESRCSALVFSNDGHIIAVGGESGDIAFWDQSRPGSSPCILRGHRDRICSLVFSPDGSTLASGGADGTIRFWNLRQMRTTPVILEGHQGEVCSIQFSRDGRILASGGEDGTVRLWIAQREVLADLVQQKFERSLSTEEWSQFVGEGFEDEHLESPLTSKPVASVSSSSGQ